MKTYTPEEQKENLRKACQALRENPKKATYRMRDHDGGRCCLCVMAEVAEDIDGATRGTYSKDGNLPSVKLYRIYGIEKANAHPWLYNFAIQGIYASSHNDGARTSEKTHAEIADMIEKEYL